VSGVLGPYVFTIEDVGQDDHADTLAGATALPASGLIAEGWMDTPNDLDWFAMDLEARPYVVRAMPGPSYELVEADGVTSVPRWGNGDIQPRAPGRHYLRVGHPLAFSTPGKAYRWEMLPR
jgi:hypothetical protein